MDGGFFSLLMFITSSSRVSQSAFIIFHREIKKGAKGTRSVTGFMYGTESFFF